MRHVPGYQDGGCLMADSDHGRLVGLGARWLRKQGFAVVATELNALACMEIPDVVGFRAACSVVLEVKVSRADFFADAKKPHRQPGAPALGTYRFMLCPEGMVATSELPPGWGLLQARGRVVEPVLAPVGNIWPPKGSGPDDWRAFQHESDLKSERAVLFSLLRRGMK